VAGVHVTVNGKAGDVHVEEAGRKLVYDYTDKLWELVNIFKGQRTRVMVLADTHTETEEAEEMKRMLMEQGIGMAFTPAQRDAETGHVGAGVMIWWDASEMGNAQEEEVWEARALRVKLQETRTQEERTYYGVYMPVRGRSDNAQEVEETWGAHTIGHAFGAHDR